MVLVFRTHRGNSQGVLILGWFLIWTRFLQFGGGLSNSGLIVWFLHKCVCVCVCVCVAGWWHQAHDKSRLWQRQCTSSSAGSFYGLLRGAELYAGNGEVHCPELHLLILYQQTERRLGQLCCS